MENQFDEVSPPGWSGTVRAMKRHPDKISNPWALAWFLKNKIKAHPHYKPEEKDKPPDKKDKYKNESLDTDKKAPVDPPVDVDPAIANSWFLKKKKCKTFKEFLEEKGFFA